MPQPLTEPVPGTDSLGDLMTQSAARREARSMNDRGIPAVATTVPAGCWGGTEKGWTVYIGDPYATTR
jgi:hypothetical protein